MADQAFGGLVRRADLQNRCHLLPKRPSQGGVGTCVFILSDPRAVLVLQNFGCGMRLNSAMAGDRRAGTRANIFACRSHLLGRQPISPERAAGAEPSARARPLPLTGTRSAILRFGIAGMRLQRALTASANKLLCDQRYRVQRIPSIRNWIPDGYASRGLLF